MSKSEYLVRMKNELIRHQADLDELIRMEQSGELIRVDRMMLLMLLAIKEMSKFVILWGSEAATPDADIDRRLDN